MQNAFDSLVQNAVFAIQSKNTNKTAIDKHKQINRKIKAAPAPARLSKKGRSCLVVFIYRIRERSDRKNYKLNKQAVGEEIGGLAK